MPVKREDIGGEVFDDPIYVGVLPQRAGTVNPSSMYDQPLAKIMKTRGKRGEWFAVRSVNKDHQAVLYGAKSNLDALRRARRLPHVDGFDWQFAVRSNIEDFPGSSVLFARLVKDE